MRYVQIEDGLRLRFPGRSDEFDTGVEVGVAAALMAISDRPFVHRLCSDTVTQVLELASKLGFHVDVEATGENWSDLRFERGRRRARLVLAHSAARGSSPAMGEGGGVHVRALGAHMRPELRAV